MGCTQTINFYPQTPEAYEHKTVFDKLALNERDVQKLHKVRHSLTSIPSIHAARHISLCVVAL